MPATKQKAKMPPNKNQFGIIVPTAVHTQVKHKAADLGWRISDVYAEGAKLLIESANMGMGPEEAKLVRDITRGVEKRDWVFYTALAEFLRGRPREDQIAMLEILLGNFLPESARRVRKHG